MMIDAYCHIGLPRFSSARDVLTTFDLFGIDRGVVVLGPQVPDYEALITAQSLAPDRIRTIGIPFGQNETQQREVVDLQIKAGVSGLRVQPEELFRAPWLLDVLGRHGLWLYMINWVDHPTLYQPLLDWLIQYPNAHLGAPHFLQPNPLPEPAKELLKHPRVFPIFSRHGGVGSREPYPHEDLRSWVESVVQITGLERVMWGSEYPVFYWRSETMPACRDWLANLLPAISPQARNAYLGGNAARLFFNNPAPLSQPVTYPGWVNEQFQTKRSVPLFQGAPFELPMVDYARLQERFVAAQIHNPGLTFGAFLAGWIKAKLDHEDHG